MTLKDQIRIRNAATDLLRDLWRSRERIWAVPPLADGLLPIPVDVIACKLLDLTLEEPEEMRFGHEFEQYEVAGFLDRAERRIVIAQKFPLEWRRFTMAHEIAHWMLHPDVTSHRDRALCGGERANGRRPLQEQEADVFAAELLMPTKALKRRFIDAFGGPFDGRKIDSEVAFWLSAGVARRGIARRVTEVDLSSNLRYRAMIIAETASFAGHHFSPLTDAFGVSPTALAIQLEDLGLVT